MAIDPDEGLEAHAGEVSTALRLLANEKRLLALCHLAGAGEMSVGALSEAVGLSQSALSQHLARLRADRLVTARREGQVLNYRISDPRVEALLSALRVIYCPK
ncbi:MAG: helix-turn-helix transcriptional regulator [Rhodobacteraceae bacterium]|nr:helix-turn-helix transcriptional regulator [Paracoccaceae bacterium]